MDKSHEQAQIDDLSKRVDELQGKMTQMMTGVQEIKDMLAKGQHKHGHKEWDECKHAHHWHSMKHHHKHWPMRGMCFCMMMLAIAGMCIKLGILKGFVACKMREYPAGEYHKHWLKGRPS